ncbi:Holliday junction resolvase RuvX [Marinospirillum sp.]|uniref:Holliday junction resolvase RuvX n=1 Tax=Marinospirillum sp. TaxID=2183934 RepID=UPI003A88F9EC
MLEAVAPRRIMAFDFGTKRHGIALGNELTASVTPLMALPAQDGIPAWQLLDQLVAEWQPDCFVMGLPLEEDGRDTPLSLRARKMAKRLFGRYGQACFSIDERGTTRAAKAIVREQGHRGNYREDPVDSLAAALLLETWLQLDPEMAQQSLIAGPHYHGAASPASPPPPNC